MPNQREVEIKFVIGNARSLANKLKSCGFQLLTRRTHEMNTLYDLPGGVLRQRGALLRLRQYGPKWTITYKDRGKLGRHKSRREIETEIKGGHEVAAILDALGFRPSFVYEKFRTEWGHGVGHVVVDHTPIGDFGEIEGPPRWIDSAAKRLGISPDQYITASYAELFQEWKRGAGSRASHMLFSQTKRRMR